VNRGSKKRLAGQASFFANDRTPPFQERPGALSALNERLWSQCPEASHTVWHTIGELRSQAIPRPVRRLLGAARRRTLRLLQPSAGSQNGLPAPAEALPERIAEQSSTLPAHLLDRALLEVASRQESRAVYLGDSTVLCRVLGKYLVYADAQETGITPHLAMDGYWESWITVALARTLRRGWHCLDVGANHGYYTLVMADAVGPEGRVVPVEPTPRLAELLRETLDVNGFPHVAVAQQAATDTAGETLQLVVPARRSMNARLSGEAGPTDAVVDVQSITIDAVTEGWPRVDLIKIDVEGAEESVWQGMQRTIADNPEIIVLLELNVDRYDDPAGFLSLIQEAGFRLRYIDIDAEAKDVAVEELLSRNVGQDWMLYLARR
jgi:FkbM family methyltransferase